MSAGLNLPLPQGKSFLQWAQLLVEALARYNVPNPENEDLWLAWAVRVFAIPEVMKLGVVDPRGFPRWQDWATTLLQVSN